MDRQGEWENFDVADPDEVSLTEGVERRRRRDAAESSGQVIWRLMNLMMTIFFLMASGVQFNDPDPYLWVPLYGAAALLTCCVAVHPQLSVNKTWRGLYWLHASFCLAMFLYVLTELFITISSSSTAQTLNPLTYEEGRELAGIMITAAWLFICKQSPTIRCPILKNCCRCNYQDGHCRAVQDRY